MKLSHILTLGVLVASPFISGTAATVPTPLTQYKFSDTTPLAKGLWVRVAAADEGMYEISYDQLRQMGFSDPSKVAVYGQGGNMLDFNFTSSTGVKYYNDNPKQIATYHTGNKLVFYSSGLANVKPTSANSSQNVRFDTDGKNIYSDKAYYLLSDVNGVADIRKGTTAEYPGSSAKTNAFTYYYHENDLSQAGGATGQIFYGERMSPSSPLTFQLRVPYISDRTAYTHIRSKFALQEGNGGTMTISFNGTQSTSSTSVGTSIMKVLEAYGTNFKFQPGEGGVGTAELKFSVNDNYYDWNLLALDWFTVSCPIDLNKMIADPNFSQQYVAFNATKNAKTRFAIPQNAMVWDISTKTDPAEVFVKDGYAHLVSASTTDELMVFNPNQKMKQIDADWNVVENQNLHAYKNQGIELLIFSTEDMKPYADKVATLHEKYDGIKVLVVTPTQLYNEFSSGTPDPLAYRALAKMLFQNSYRPLKNVLFFGKLSSDIRNIMDNSGFSESLIAYQQSLSNPLTKAICVMDYFGCLTDWVEYPTSIQSAPISVGVGLLPVSTHEEGANAVAKIEEYLSKEDFSNVLNETLLVSCNGDSYLHDQQSAEYSNMMQSILDTEYKSQFSHHQIRFDGLDMNARRRQYKDAFERGKLFGLYFGHGIDYGLGSYPMTYNANDFVALDNKELGFFFMAACDLCSPDLGRQGVGDVGVIKAKRGFIASIGGTRSVMSNDNESLARSFMNYHFYDKNNKLRTEMPTIGEAYALAKNIEKTPSEQAFLLFGDPAVRLPFPTGKVELEVKGGDNVHPGDILNITGKVLSNGSNNVNTDYNGYVTVKLMEPMRNVKLPVQYPREKDTDPIVYVNSNITDLRLATVQAEVKNGQFSVMIPVPDNVAEFMSEEGSDISLPILAATYDPKSRIGCSGKGFATMGLDGTEPGEDAVRDQQAPVVNLVYDPLLQVISVEVSDNIAILPGIGKDSGTSISIGGKSYQVMPETSVGVAVTNYATTISTARFAPGKYSATYYATDLAGNSSARQRFEFEVSDASPLKITAGSDFAIDEMAFNIAGDMKGEECSLIMTDRNGKVVYTTSANGASVKCDVSDLEPGIYRAAVRHNSAKGARLYSNWVEFSVID